MQAKKKKAKQYGLRVFQDKIIISLKLWLTFKINGKRVWLLLRFSEIKNKHENISFFIWFCSAPVH